MREERKRLVTVCALCHRNIVPYKYRLCEAVLVPTFHALFVHDLLALPSRGLVAIDNG